MSHLLGQSLHRPNLDSYGPPSLEAFWHYESRLINKNATTENVDATITSIQELLSKKNTKKPQLLVRLAELYEKRALIERHNEENNFLLSQTQFKNSLDSLKPRPDTGKTKYYLQKSYQSYQKLLADFPQFSRDPKINYAVGRSLILQRDSNGLMYFNHLATLKGAISEKNSAKFWSALYYFDLKRYPEAAKIFASFSRQKSGAYQSYAGYQEAWANFYAKKDTPSNMTATLKTQLSSLAKAAPLSGDKQSAQNVLKDYLFTDLAYFFATELNDSDAKEIFTKYKRPDLRLAVLDFEIRKLVASKKYDAALSLKQKLVDEYPTYAYRYLLASLELHIYFTRGDYGKVLSSLQPSAMFFDEKSPWTLENTKKIGKNFVAEVRRHLRTQILTYPNSIKRAKLAPNMRSQISIQFYEFLRKYDKESSSSLGFMVEYANALKAGGRLGDATDTLTQIVANQTFPLNDRKKVALTMISLAGTMLAQQKPQTKSPQKMPQGYPKEIKVFDSAVNAFIPLYPEDKRCPSLLFTVASHALQYGSTLNAIEIYRSVIAKYAPSSESDASMIEILAQQKKSSSWQQVEIDSESFIKRNKFFRQKTRGLIAEDLKASHLKIAEKYVAEGKEKEAAQKLESFANNYPKDNRASGALVQAFRLRKKLLNTDDISKVALTYFKNFPKDKNRAEIILTYAHILLKAGKTHESAVWFTQFARENPRHKDALANVLKGVSLFKATEEADLALKAIADFSSQNTVAAQNTELKFQKGEIYEGQGQYLKAIEIYEDLSKNKISANSTTALAAVKKEILAIRINKYGLNLKKADSLKKRISPLPYQQYFDAKNELAKLYLSVGLGTKNGIHFVERGDPANFISYSESLEKQCATIESSLKKALSVGAKKIDGETYYHLANLHRDLGRRYAILLNKTDFFDLGSYQRAHNRREKMYLAHETQANKYVIAGINSLQSVNIKDGIFYKLAKEKQKIDRGSTLRVDEVQFWPGYLSLRTSATYSE